MGGREAWRGLVLSCLGLAKGEGSAGRGGHGQCTWVCTTWAGTGATAKGKGLVVSVMECSALGDQQGLAQSRVELPWWAPGFDGEPSCGGGAPPLLREGTARPRGALACLAWARREVLSWSGVHGGGRLPGLGFGDGGDSRKKIELDFFL